MTTPDVPSLSPFPKTWAEWEELRARKQTQWIPQTSKYNKVFFDPAENVYYKIRQVTLHPELLAKCLRQNSMPPSIPNNELKALKNARTMGLNVPVSSSLACQVTDKNPYWIQSCLATSRLNGVPVRTFINSLQTNPYKMGNFIHALYQNTLPMIYCFGDPDLAAAQNVYVAPSQDKSYQFGYHDFGFSYSQGFGAQEIFIANMKKQMKDKPSFLPSKEMMREGFLSMIQRVDSCKHLLDPTDARTMLENLETGQKHSLRMLYP